MPQTNPPVPTGYVLMTQAAVTPAMTAWAVSILHDTNAFPMFATTSKTFGALVVLARVEWHPPDFNNGAIHRGVTLYTGSTAEVAEPARGIDVSSYQPAIDWPAVKASGKDFVFIKATEATGHLDHAFASHWKNAKVVAGLLRGAYHFFRPALDAAAQAKFFLEQLAADPGELPPVLDVEVADGVDVHAIAAGVATWVDAVLAVHGRVIIYTSPGFWDLLPASADAIAAKTDLWVAHWNVASPMKPRGWTKWTFWQHTSTANVPGVPSPIDGNRFNGSLEELRAYAGAAGDPFVENVTDNPGDEIV